MDVGFTFIFKASMKKRISVNLFAVLASLLFASCQSDGDNVRTLSLEQNQKVRLAKLVIDSTQLENYKAALKEEIEASVRLEPGVLTLYAVSEKNNPTHITILEIYADTNAYKAHVQTPHFLKYKTGTKEMVKSLELVETAPLIPGMKIK